MDESPQRQHEQQLQGKQQHMDKQQRNEQQHTDEQPGEQQPLNEQLDHHPRHQQDGLRSPPRGAGRSGRGGGVVGGAAGGTTAATGIFSAVSAAGASTGTKRYSRDHFGAALALQKLSRLEVEYEGHSRGDEIAAMEVESGGDEGGGGGAGRRDATSGKGVEGGGGGGGGEEQQHEERDQGRDDSDDRFHHGKLRPQSLNPTVTTKEMVISAQAADSLAPSHGFLAASPAEQQWQPQKQHREWFQQQQWQQQHPQRPRQVEATDTNRFVVDDRGDFASAAALPTSSAPSHRLPKGNSTLPPLSEASGSHLSPSPRQQHRDAKRTKANTKMVIRRRLSNATALRRLYVPLDMTCTFMPPLPSPCFGDEGRRSGPTAADDADAASALGAPSGAGGSKASARGSKASARGSKAPAGAAASGISRTTVLFAVESVDPQAGPSAGISSGGSKMDDWDDPTGGVRGGDALPEVSSSEKQAAAAMTTAKTTTHEVEYERRRFGDQVHHRLTKGWYAVCSMLGARVGDTLEMMRGGAAAAAAVSAASTSTAAVAGDDDAPPAATKGPLIFVRIVR